MSNLNKKLSKRLHLNHAYGQLIALIFVPIMVLACVGAALVLTEISNAAKAQQRHTATAILTRYEHVAQQLFYLLSQNPDRYTQARNILQYMFIEQHLQGASKGIGKEQPALLDQVLAPGDRIDADQFTLLDTVDDGGGGIPFGDYPLGARYGVVPLAADGKRQKRRRWGRRCGNSGVVSASGDQIHHDQQYAQSKP